MIQLRVSADGQVNMLLNLLINSDISISMSNIIDYLKVSRRTGFSILKRTNNLLDDLDLDEVQNVKGKGYYLTDITRQGLKEYVIGTEKLDSQPLLGVPKSLREPLLGLILLVNGMSLSGLAEAFGVTTNTMIGYIKSLGEPLAKYGLKVSSDSIKLQHITGESLNKISYLWEILNNHLDDDYFSDVITKLIGTDLISKSNYYLKMFNQTNGKYYSDDSFSQNVMLLSLVMLMIHNDLLSHPTESYTIDTGDQVYGSLEFDWLQSTYFKDEDVVPTYILVKLSKYLMGSSYRSLTAKEIPTFILEDTKKVMERFEKVTSIKIADPELFRQRLSVHLASTYWRDYYDIKYINPNVTAIKLHYADVLELTSYAIVPFEKRLSGNLSLDELALIATYLGGELRNHRSPVKESPIVLLVCSSGIGTSLLLKRQLEERYPDSNFLNPISLQQLEDYDLEKVTNLVTTTHVPGEFVSQMHTPVIKVHAIPNDQEWKELDKQFNLVHRGATTQSVNTLIDIISNYARVEDFDGLSEALTTFMLPQEYQHTNTPKSLWELLMEDSHIKIIDETIDWQDALKLAGTVLIDEEVIANRYLDAIVNLTNNLGTYMVISDDIMLAHAKPEDGVNQLGISLLINKQPMQVGNKQVKWLILLSTPDAKQHLGALEQLLTLLQTPDVLDVTDKSVLRTIIKGLN